MFRFPLRGVARGWLSVKPVSSTLWGHWLAGALPRCGEGPRNALTQSYMFLKTAKVRCFNSSFLGSLTLSPLLLLSVSFSHPWHWSGLGSLGIWLRGSCLGDNIQWGLNGYIYLYIVYGISSQLSIGMAARDNAITRSRTLWCVAGPSVTWRYPSVPSITSVCREEQN